MSKPKYDGTVARIAGNLLSGTYLPEGEQKRQLVAAAAVAMARAIVAETIRTEQETPHDAA